MAEINIFRHDRDAYEVAAGTVLFTEGEPGDAMYAVVEGAVEVRHGATVYERVGPGGILGELALIDNTPRSADAVAVEASKIVKVDQARFVYLVQEHPTFALMVLKVMAERLRRNTA